MGRLGYRAFACRVAALVLVTWAVTGSSTAFAQAPAAPAPPPLWKGDVSAGLALTSGNADTNTFNATFALVYDPDNPHRATADLLYLRGTSEGEAVVDRSTFAIRDNYALTERASLFGQLRYLRDTFKAIDYLAATTGGVAYQIVNLASTKFAIDAGAGVVWERNTGLGTNTSGAITLGESFRHQLTDTTTITHEATGLWKTSDVGDALYSVRAGLAAALTSRTQLKVEVLELYKSLPPAGVDRADLSLITSVVYSF